MFLMSKLYPVHLPLLRKFRIDASAWVSTSYSLVLSASGSVLWLPPQVLPSKFAYSNLNYSSPSLSQFCFSWFQLSTVIHNYKNIKWKILEINNAYVLNGSYEQRDEIAPIQLPPARTWIMPLSSISTLYRIPIHSRPLSQMSQYYSTCAQVTLILLIMVSKGKSTHSGNSDIPAVL